MSVASTMSSQPHRPVDAAVADRRDADLFENAPPIGVQRRLGLVKPGELNVGRRALLVVLIGWLPLVLLTVGQTVLLGGDGVHSLLVEVGVHARYLIAAPLLVIAEAQCATYLSGTVRHFLDTGLIPDEKRGQFNTAIESTRRLLASRTVEFALFVLAYLATVVAVVSHGVDDMPTWHRSLGLSWHYSAAGWWHLLVSLPLLTVLVYGWLWRLALWTRLLWMISRLDLRLVASHPDHVAGLGFVGHSLRAFAIVALALATIAAGRSAHAVLTGGGLPTPNLLFNVVYLGSLLILFVAPLLVFSPILLKAWQRGTMEYGALAARVGESFEAKWLGRGGGVDQTALEKPDFSATADLYSVAANANAVRFVPVDLKNLIVIVGALLLPFVPVVLLAVPINVLWTSFKKMMF
jgi:hypothetical protein